MSVHVSSWAWKQRAGKAKLVLLKLADNANDEGVAWPTQRRLAEECELNERTIREHIETLQKLGLVEVVRAEDRRGRPAQYHLLISGENLRKPGVLAEEFSGVTGRNLRSLIGRETVTEPSTTGAPPARNGSNRKRGQRRDQHFEALLEVCSIDAGSLTESGRGAANRALRELRQVGATPEEIRRRAASFRRRYSLPLTPSALAKHWASLVHEPNGKLSDEERSRRLEQRMAERSAS